MRLDGRTHPAVEPIAVDATHAASMFDMSARTWRRWNSAGLIPLPSRCGGKVLWRVSELKAWADAGMPPREVWVQHRSQELN